MTKECLNEQTKVNHLLILQHSLTSWQLMDLKRNLTSACFNGLYLGHLSCYYALERGTTHNQETTHLLPGNHPLTTKKPPTAGNHPLTARKPLTYCQETSHLLPRNHPLTARKPPTYCQETIHGQVHYLHTLHFSFAR